MTIFIIAEIGINHNGDMSICKKLIDAAVDAGCNAVKFQKRDLNFFDQRTELICFWDAYSSAMHFGRKDRAIEFEVSPTPGQ